MSTLMCLPLTLGGTSISTWTSSSVYVQVYFSAEPPLPTGFCKFFFSSSSSSSSLSLSPSFFYSSTFCSSIFSSTFLASSAFFCCSFCFFARRFASLLRFLSSFFCCSATFIPFSSLNFLKWRLQPPTIYFSASSIQSIEKLRKNHLL